MSEPKIHASASVHPSAKIGEDTQIWLWCQVREKTTIGKQCIFGKGVYVDSGVEIGNRVKIQNNVSLFHGVKIGDGVFIGPHVCFTNDLFPRAINRDGSLKSADDWTITPTKVGYGASLGANSTIKCGVKIGDWAMVGAGSVVTRNVPAHGLVVGNPARLVGYVCSCGAKLTGEGSSRKCQACGETVQLPKESAKA
jgi:acetyltransferase-like isoleucine patch superfamily enzyme